MLCEYGKRAPDVRAERAKGVKGWPRGGVDGPVLQVSAHALVFLFILLFLFLIYIFPISFEFKFHT